MKAYGDIESVNLSTGERFQRVSGDGESRLVRVGCAKELARCDREIARIYEEKRKGNPDHRGILQGLFDWEVEKILIARTSHPNGEAQPNSNTEKRCDKCNEPAHRGLCLNAPDNPNGDIEW